MEVPGPAPLQELSGKEEGQVPGTEMLGAHEALHHQAEDAAGLPHMGAQAAAPAAMSHPELGDDGEATDDDEPSAKRMRAGEGQPEAPTASQPGEIDPALAACLAAAAAAAPMQGVAADGSLVTQDGMQGQEGDPAAAAAAQLMQQQQQQQQQQGAMLLPLDPAAAAALGLTPEQQAQMQQIMFPMMSAEALAAASAGMPTGPDGQPLPLPLPPMMGGGGEQHPMTLDPSSFLNMNIVAPDGSQLTPEQMVQMFSNAQLSFVMPLNSPGQLPPGMELGSDGVPTYKNWWDEKDEKELMGLVEDPSYRLEKLGTEELDWSLVASHFGGRSQNALRKKYWMLSKRQSTDSDADAPTLTTVDPNKRPRADRKLWSEAETRELMQLATDPQYRAQVLHLEEGVLDADMWETISMHFGCSVQTAKRKFRHSHEAMLNGTLGAEKAKRQHYRKKTPYRWMIVSALFEIPNQQGTAIDIFERIEANSNYSAELDTRIMPGTKSVPRWKIQIRKVLSADKIFQHTGLKQKHETVWRLNQVELQNARSSSRNNTGRGLAALSGAVSPGYQHQQQEAAMPAGGGRDSTGDGGAAAGGGGGGPVTTEELNAAMHASAAANMGGAVDPAVVQQMQLMHEQIAAAILNGGMQQHQQHQHQQQPEGMAGMVQPMDAGQLQAAYNQMQQVGQAGAEAAAGAVLGQQAVGGEHEHGNLLQQQQQQHDPQQHNPQQQQQQQQHDPQQGGHEHSAGEAHGQPDANQLASIMQQLTQHLEQQQHHQHQHQHHTNHANQHDFDHATLAAMAAAASGMGLDHGGGGGLTLPMVHTVEVPAPLEDEQEHHHQHLEQHHHHHPEQHHHQQQEQHHHQQQEQHHHQQQEHLHAEQHHQVEQHHHPHHHQHNHLMGGGQQ